MAPSAGRQSQQIKKFSALCIDDAVQAWMHMHSELSEFCNFRSTQLATEEPTPKRCELESRQLLSFGVYVSVDPAGVRRVCEFVFSSGKGR